MPRPPAPLTWAYQSSSRLPPHPARQSAPDPPAPETKIIFLVQRMPNSGSRRMNTYAPACMPITLAACQFRLAICVGVLLSPNTVACWGALAVRACARRSPRWCTLAPRSRTPRMPDSFCRPRLQPSTFRIRSTGRLFPETILSRPVPSKAVGPGLHGRPVLDADREGRAVDLQIRIDGGTADDCVALADYLNGNRDFRGRVRLVTGPPADGKLSAGIVEMLTVMVG